jgi:hypothetical protein
LKNNVRLKKISQIVCYSHMHKLTKSSFTRWKAKVRIYCSNYNF